MNFLNKKGLMSYILVLIMTICIIPVTYAQNNQTNSKAEEMCHMQASMILSMAVYERGAKKNSLKENFHEIITNNKEIILIINYSFTDLITNKEHTKQVKTKCGLDGDSKMLKELQKTDPKIYQILSHKISSIINGLNDY